MSTPELTSELPRRGPGDSPPAGWRQIASVWLRRFSPSQGWATLGFLALMLVVVGESITSARWVETPGLVLLLVLSAMAGMVLAKVRARWYLLQTLGLLVGGLVVTPVAQNLFDARRWREVVLDGLFAPGGDYDYMLYAGGHGLLHHVVDERPVS